MSKLFSKRESEPSMLNMEDDHLRHVEKDVIIPRMVRQAAKDACADLVKEFEECARGRTISAVFKCREQNNRLEECVKANATPEYYEKQKAIYLEQRRQARQQQQQQQQQQPTTQQRLDS